MAQEASTRSSQVGATKQRSFQSRSCSIFATMAKVKVIRAQVQDLSHSWTTKCVICTPPPCDSTRTAGMPWLQRAGRCHRHRRSHRPRVANVVIRCVGDLSWVGEAANARRRGDSINFKLQATGIKYMSRRPPRPQSTSPVRDRKHNEPH